MIYSTWVPVSFQIPYICMSQLSGYFGASETGQGQRMSPWGRQATAIHNALVSHRCF